jgi:hypothetical protein
MGCGAANLACGLSSGSQCDTPIYSLKAETSKSLVPHQFLESSLAYLEARTTPVLFTIRLPTTYINGVSRQKICIEDHCCNNIAIQTYR